MEEYDRFVDLFRQFDIEISFLPRHVHTGLDSIYTNDPVIISDNGAILCNMGKLQRRGEPGAVGEYLTEIEVPILGQITGEGTLEGGDVVWVHEQTVAVGQGYRSSAEGIRQLKREMPWMR